MESTTRRITRCNITLPLEPPEMSCDIDIPLPPCGLLCVTVGYSCLSWPGHWKRFLISMMIIIFKHFKMSMHFSALNNSKSYLIIDLHA